MLFIQTFDINMNTAASSRPATSGEYPADALPGGLSKIQSQVSGLFHSVHLNAHHYKVKVIISKTC